MRRNFSRALAGLCVGTLALGLGTAPTAAKEKITYGYLIDPALEGVLYAIKQGIVKSDRIEIVGKALAIPALIQSTPTKRFDVLMNAVMAIPLAAKRGLKLVVLSSALRAGKGGLGAGIWVKDHRQLRPALYWHDMDPPCPAQEIQAERVLQERRHELGADSGASAADSLGDRAGGRCNLDPFPSLQGAWFG